MNSIIDLQVEIDQMKGYRCSMLNDFSFEIDNDFDFFNTAFIHYLNDKCPPLNLEYGFDKTKGTIMVIEKLN